MIDTDKYEGHTVNRRDKLGTFAGNDIYVWTYFAQELPSWTSKADFLLVEDAPLLLAEVKRLHEQQQRILRIAELNKALEWGETDASVEWAYIIDIINGDGEE
tara:strand:- start:28474 stop:28782 length:309 start_codon:yes stop_codon:yes gene_type:complete